MSQLGRIREQVLEEWKSLNSQWQATTSQWGDAPRYRFEHEFYQQFEPAINGYIKELDRLDNLVEQARKDIP